MNYREGEAIEVGLEYELISELLLSYLKTKRRLFLSMRDRFGLDDSVGLASYPAEHANSPAFVLTAHAVNGALHVCGDDEGSLVLNPVRGKVKKQTIILPRLRNNRGSIITLGLPEEQYEVSPDLAIRIFTNEAVLTGMLAHELAHCLPRLPRSLRQRLNAVQATRIAPTAYDAYQSATDLIAASKGFGAEVSEALSHWAEITKVTAPENRAKFAEIDYRLAMIREFCGESI